MREHNGLTVPLLAVSLAINDNEHIIAEPHSKAWIGSAGRVSPYANVAPGGGGGGACLYLVEF